MTKSIKKLFLAGMASAVMMTVASCEKTDPQPDEKPDEKKPKVETKAYQELWIEPAYAGSVDVNEIVIIWSDGKETAYRLFSQGSAKFQYDGKEPLLSVNDNILDQGRDGIIFSADANDTFKIIMNNGSAITGVPDKNASIKAMHYSGERVDLSVVVENANKQITKGTINNKYQVLGFNPL